MFLVLSMCWTFTELETDDMNVDGTYRHGQVWYSKRVYPRAESYRYKQLARLTIFANKSKR